MAKKDFTSDALTRIVRAYARRADEGDLQVLVDLHDLRELVDQAERDAVDRLRRGNYPKSWAQIGDALGTTRQAAQQRFKGTNGERKVGGQPAHLR